MVSAQQGDGPGPKYRWKDERGLEKAFEEAKAAGAQQAAQQSETAKNKEECDKHPRCCPPWIQGVPHDERCGKFKCSDWGL